MLEVSAIQSTEKIDQSTTAQQGPEDKLKGYIDGRKVALEPDVILSISSNDLSADHYINTLVEASKLSILTVPSFNDDVLKYLDTWLHGERCPTETLNSSSFVAVCLCKQAHEKRPNQKLGGIYDENSQVVKENKKEVSVTESTLALAACKLIEAEIRPDEAENEYKLAIQLLNKAYSKNKKVAIKRIQSWLIQYAFANDIVKRCSLVENIKILKSTINNKLSDVWQCTLIGSGLYKGSEVFASPLILKKELPNICFLIVRLNHFYPRTAFSDSILHFARTDIFSIILYDIDSFSSLSSDYKILVNALHNAIFKDSARHSLHVSNIIEQITKKDKSYFQSVGSRDSSHARQKKSLVRNSVRYSVSLSDNSAYNIMQYKTSPTDKYLHLTPDSQRVTIKSGGRPKAAYVLDKTDISIFPEPTDIETAMTILFNIMTYEKSQYKTLFYNTPDYKNKVTESYRLLQEHYNDESLPLPLFGYINFLLGWMHEEKLVESPSLEATATFYENAASKQQFLPLLKRAGDIYENIGDLQSAHRCFSTLHKTITNICDCERKMPKFKPFESEEIPEYFEEDDVEIGSTIGYLSSDFRDILVTKIQFLEIKKEEDKYLCHLPAEEVQSYIEESHGNMLSAKELKKLTFSNKGKTHHKKELCSKILEPGSVINFTAEPEKSTIKAEVNKNTALSFDEASDLDEHSETEGVESVFTPMGNTNKRKKKKKKKTCTKASEPIPVVNVIDDLKKPTIKAQVYQSTAVSSNKASKLDEHPKIKNATTVVSSVFQDKGKGKGVRNTRLGVTPTSSTGRNRTFIANSITNLLSVNWDCNVKLAIIEIQKSKREGLGNHHENIQNLNKEINKITRSNRHKVNGVEALMEHLAWEHIYYVSNGGSRSVIRENLNKAKELFLMTLNKKVNVKYSDVPDPKQLECDVLQTLEYVKDILSQDVINEWLFGITCQARSMAHVFSHFKAVYPKNKSFVRLYQSWYSLKSLHQYNKEI